MLPLGLWRGAMVVSITMVYFLATNGILLTVRAPQRRYRLIKPLTKLLLSRPCLWVAGVRLHVQVRLLALPSHHSG
jgi:hypothetical protein